MALRTKDAGRFLFTIVALLTIIATAGIVRAAPQAQGTRPQPRLSTEAAFDKTAPLRDLAKQAVMPSAVKDLPPERGPVVVDRGYSGDGALDAASESASAQATAQIASPLISFEGLRNTDNARLVNPPDPVGDIGPNHYVEMVNLVFAVYSRTGTRLLGPLPLGVLWQDFAITDCQDLAGDPIVIYDQLADRWLLSQFTTRGPIYYNCVAISQTGDPTGAYYRYAFSSGENFPDYPKYGVWSNSYLITTREFGPVDEYGIGVYAVERNKMINGEANVRTVSYFLDSEQIPISLIGDGLLPPDLDGTRRPQDQAPAPIVGTQDDDHPYGATFDALNIWDLAVKWNATPESSLKLTAQLPVAEFDSVFPCAPTARDCIPQPGITDPNQKIDILSYRQRPTWRLAYRNFGKYETMVTNQSVEARPGIAGVRWYEIRRLSGQYSLYQQGTFAPDDGIHRWMGSIAMDKFGNLGLGYSVANETVYPGIRYTGRLRGDPLGTMPLGEAVLINGSGSQLTTNSRWGDYTSMNIDPTDDCTFWYVNEYYETTSLAGWQTRIGSFRLPGC